MDGVAVKKATPAKRIGQARTVDPDHANCKALGHVLDRIGDKWTVMVVGALSKGPMRFNALLRLIDGVSHRMLTLTLRGLERDGLVKRTVYASVPPKVEYELTAVGASLVKPIRALSEWALKHQPAIETARGSNRAATEAAVVDVHRRGQWRDDETDASGRPIAQPYNLIKVPRSRPPVPVAGVQSTVRPHQWAPRCASCETATALQAVLPDRGPHG